MRERLTYAMVGYLFTVAIHLTPQNLRATTAGHGGGESSGGGADTSGGNKGNGESGNKPESDSKSHAKNDESKPKDEKGGTGEKGDKADEKPPKTLDDLKKEITEKGNPSKEDLESWQKDLERMLAEADAKPPADRTEEEKKIIDDIRVLQEKTSQLMTGAYPKLPSTPGDPNGIYGPSNPTPENIPSQGVIENRHVPEPLVEDSQPQPIQSAMKEFADMELQNRINEKYFGTTPNPTNPGGATTTPPTITYNVANNANSNSNPNYNPGPIANSGTQSGNGGNGGNGSSNNNAASATSTAPAMPTMNLAAFSLPISGAVKSLGQLDSAFFNSLGVTPSATSGESAFAPTAKSAPVSPGGREYATAESSPGRSLASVETPRLLDGGVAPTGNSVARSDAPRTFAAAPIAIPVDAPSASTSGGGSFETTSFSPSSPTGSVSAPTSETRSVSQPETMVFDKPGPKSEPARAMNGRELEMTLSSVATSLWSEDRAPASAGAREATPNAPIAEIAKSGGKFDDSVMRVLTYSHPETISVLSNSGAAVGSVVRGVLLARRGNLSSTTNVEKMKPVLAAAPTADAKPSDADKMMKFAR